MVPRPEFRRPPVRLHRLERFPRLVEQDREVVVRLAEFRVRGEGLPEFRLRLAAPAHERHHFAQLVRHHRRRLATFGSGGEHILRFAQLAALNVDAGQGHRRLRVLARDLEQAPVADHRLVDAAQLVVGVCQPEQGLPVLGIERQRALEVRSRRRRHRPQGA